MYKIATPQACSSVSEAAKSKGDDDMLLIIQGCREDLVAAHVQYHKACYATYTSKSNIKLAVEQV